MALTLGDIRTKVRQVLDVDVDEVPDTLIDGWAREASNRIYNQIQEWSFFEHSWSVSVTSGTANYDLDDDVASAGMTPKAIIAVQGDNRNLRYISPQKAREMFPPNHSGGGDPRWWTIFAGDLILYPTPSRAETMTVLGYRKVNDWVAEGAGSEPDFPEELHNAVLNWCLGKAYIMQEDTVLGDGYISEFQNEVALLANRDASVPHEEPFVIGGGDPRRSYPPFPFVGPAWPTEVG